MTQTDKKVDVAIIGAGPGGTTLGSFLRLYDKELTVKLFERETFPRDHVGESQLPLVSKVLSEMGVWDRIEACGFPIKVGATYRWGNSDDLWDFDFLAGGEFDDKPRPSPYSGQRTFTAFQVDRAVYDEVLSDYATELGCEIEFGNGVRKVYRTGDRVDFLEMRDGSQVVADMYVDASGHTGVLRRAMDVEIEEPSALKNIAVWDYWQNAEWAETIGIGGTRIQIMSLGYGWLWFIPIGETRTSIGFVCPADYYKSSGLPIEELYMKALTSEPRLNDLVLNARREDKLTTTKDWSFVAKRMSGENWFLVGEAGGFADPILSAGLTLTHVGAKELAFLILESRKGGDRAWMSGEYARRNERRVRQHIQFADYWYKANSHFSDLKQYTAEIAKGSGLELSAEEAFQWLGTGGFAEEDGGVAGLALNRFDRVQQMAGKLSKGAGQSMLNGYNVFTLDTADAEQITTARFEEGRVTSAPALKRGPKILPLDSLFGTMIEAMTGNPRFDDIYRNLVDIYARARIPFDSYNQQRVWECLDAMIRDGWVQRSLTKDLEPITHSYLLESSIIHKRDS